MPNSRYLKLLIGEQQVQVSDPEELPVAIDYSLEDPDNFQIKKSSEALSLTVPATLMNEKAANTFRNASIIDLTEGQVFRSNQKFTIDENGFEIMKGKAFLKSAKHKALPTEYIFDLFGDNADWKIDLEEATLYDFLKNIVFPFTKQIITDSWAYDGTQELLPYVFAPVRYRYPMGGFTMDANQNVVTDDKDMKPIYMKPSISKYWLLYWGFKSVGYKIKSDFANTEYFRRQVMPWTWGSFLESDGTRLDTHAFLAKGTNSVSYYPFNGHHDINWDLMVSNDSTDGAFDNNNSYSYNAANAEMIWQYKPPHYGLLSATFKIAIDFDIDINEPDQHELYITIQWYRNGVAIPGDNGLPSTHPGGNYIISPLDMVFTSNLNAFFRGIKEMYLTTLVDPADNGGTGTIVSCIILVHSEEGKLGRIAATATVLEFKTEFFKIPIGGTIDFANYTGLKQHKFLDFFRGCIDEFNWSINTDPINKIVLLEPTHEYATSDNLSDKKDGYFVNDHVDWDKKIDLSKEWELVNFSDYDRELTFKYKDDTNDGVLKKVQDRNTSVLAAGKYVFPERFKAGKKNIENRFFSPTMHYEVAQWQELGTGLNLGIMPQMVCLIPENISNTSNASSSNTFLPKSTYYKGLVTGVGAWRFDGEVLQSFPYMFSVNYKEGGEKDPILSYSDERIRLGSGFVIGKGLLKRFYWQRLAIIRNGQWYNGWFLLKNIDVVNVAHREHKAFTGQKWELIQIRQYKPLQEGSTSCLIRKWAPISIDDFNNTYPSSANVLTNNSTDKLDIQYTELKALVTDIPQ